MDVVDFHADAGSEEVSTFQRKATTNLLKVHIHLCLVQSHVVKPGKYE